MLSTDRLENQFGDFKPRLNRTEAETEANRCIDCYGAPCISACPTGINIPQFISRIANGNSKGAAKTILSSNILGLSCASACPTEVLCEGACVYHSLNKKPIMIGKLQRFAVEAAYEEGARFFEPGADTGFKVALIGAGPASLACAHELRRLGHQAVIFEKSKVAGGLNTSGIAPYKMRAETSLREVEGIRKMGVEFRYGQELGQEIGLNPLLKEYGAVFLGLGLGPDSRPPLPGSESPEASRFIHGAVDFIAKLKLLPSSELAGFLNTKCAVVIGGGNTALDACRELKKLGIERVVVLYRRGEADMSGYRHELAWARQEGVEFRFHARAARVEAGASAAKPKSEPLRLQLESGETLETGLVLFATGQSKLESLLAEVPELRFEQGRLITAPDGKTHHPRIYAGGDLANGGKEVVNAVAEGKRAAHAIDQAFRGDLRNG